MTMTEVKIISRVFFPVDSESGLNFAVACILTEKINVFYGILRREKCEKRKIFRKYFEGEDPSTECQFFFL